MRDERRKMILIIKINHQMLYRHIVHTYIYVYHSYVGKSFFGTKIQQVKICNKNKYYFKERKINFYEVDIHLKFI